MKFQMESIPILCDFHSQQYQSLVVDSIFLTLVNEHEVKLDINSLKNGLSPGKDEITVKVLKETADYICRSLSCI